MCCPVMLFCEFEGPNSGMQVCNTEPFPHLWSPCLAEGVAECQANPGLCACKGATENLGPAGEGLGLHGSLPSSLTSGWERGWGGFRRLRVNLP